MCETLNNRDIIFIIVTVLAAGLEYWLGKTDKTKSGSMLELIYNLIVAILRLKK